MSLMDKHNRWLAVAKKESMGSSPGDKRRWIEMLPLSEIKTVLCVGVGDGVEMGFFMDRGIDVTGITLNENDVVTLKDKFKKIFYMDMHEMDFPDNTFDLIWAKDSFEHSVSHIIAISEYSRVVKSKKYVMIICPHEERWGRSPHHFICPTLLQIKNLGMKVELTPISDSGHGGDLTHCIFKKH